MLLVSPVRDAILGASPASGVEPSAAAQLPAAPLSPEETYETVAPAPRPAAVRPIEPAMARRERELTRHWAPVFYQDTSATDHQADFLTAVDFDGDWVANNNWQNLKHPDANLNAVVYGALVETETHCFMTYATFHPRDWNRFCSVNCHENDMEGVTVVVEKDGSKHGRFVCMFTQAHSHFHAYTNDPRLKAGTLRHLHTTGVAFEDGSHPAVFIEDKGHGVYGLDPATLEPGGQPFPEGDGVVYRVADKGERPQSGDDRQARYELRSIHDELWARQDQIGDGRLYDKPFVHEGRTLPGSFDGNDYIRDSANPPWAWDADDGAKRGDQFMRPAETLQLWLKVPGEVSTRYLYNPYLGVDETAQPPHRARR